jgi:phospholipid/cholesterol/gamma-HCH transport system substrate-binding protein
MEQTPLSPPRVKHLGLKVGVLLTLIPLVMVALLAYALYARGVFEGSQRLTLLARDAEGVSIGMLVVFSGFPIGQVVDMALTEDGEVRVELRVRERDMRWLRSSSEFTVEKPLFGEAKIRVSNARLRDPPLTPDLSPALKRRDATQELPQVIARANSILENIDRLTRPESSLNQSLDNLQAVTSRMTGEHGVLGGLAGSPERARDILDTIRGVGTMVASLNRVAAQAEAVLAKADQRVFGQDGVMDETQRTIAQLGAMLGEARDSLRTADALLADAQGATADVRAMTGNLSEATRDLGALRAEVDESIRRVSGLIEEIDRKWPFARKSEITLP